MTKKQDPRKTATAAAISEQVIQAANAAAQSTCRSLVAADAGTGQHVTHEEGPCAVPAAQQYVPYAPDPHQELEVLKALSWHFGDLSGWSPTMVVGAIQHMRKMNEDLIDRTHRANVRRMRALLGWAYGGCGKVTWFQPEWEEMAQFDETGRIDFQSPASGERILARRSANSDDAHGCGVLEGALVGDQRFSLRQIVYARAVRKADGPYVLDLPYEIVWVRDGVAQWYGRVERPLVDDVVFFAGGAVVPLEIKLVSQTMMPALPFGHLDLYEPDLQEKVDLFDFAVDELPPECLTDPEDGRPLRFLPEILRLAMEPHYSPMAGMDTAGMIRWHGSRLRGEQAMRMATDAQSR